MNLPKFLECPECKEIVHICPTLKKKRCTCPICRSSFGYWEAKRFFLQRYRNGLIEIDREKILPVVECIRLSVEL